MGRLRQILVITGFAQVMLLAPIAHASETLEVERKVKQSSLGEQLTEPLYPGIRLPSINELSPIEDEWRALKFNSIHHAALIQYEFKGPWGPILKYGQRRLRSLWGDYIQEQSQSLNFRESRRLWEDQANAYADMEAGGRWWELRTSWIDYLPPEKGGAPDRPVVITYGSDATWDLGPLKISNSFRVRINRLGFLKLNADPDVRPDSTRPPTRLFPNPLAVDVHSASSPSVGSVVNFAVKPHIRIGVPEDGNWFTALKSAILRAQVDISMGGVKIARLECGIGFKPGEGAMATFDLALLNW